MTEPSELRQLYQDAVTRLGLAAKECQKSVNVNLTVMLLNCQECGHLLEKIERLDVNPIRQSALIQLKMMLIQQQSILSKKISQLDGIESSPMSDGNSTTGSDEMGQNRRLAIEDTIVVKGHLKFDDVAGLEEAKQTLKEAVIIPLQFPHLFTGGRKPWNRILLFGPPGTGKSRLAQAVSSEISSTFYCVSSSDLVSSWVGESEKLIKELFVHATKQGGRSVIFIDEIDSICRKRSSSEAEHTRRVKTELLKQMEGADNADMSNKIFLLCATNCPWELDSAFLRRFQKRIYIPLPDSNARVQLMKIHSRDNNVQLTEEGWEVLASNTHNFSGSDIATMTLGALFEPIRSLQNAKYWKRREDGRFEPCDSLTANSFEALMTDLPPDKVFPRQVTIDDFIKSLKINRQTVTMEELQRFQDFTSTFGQHG